jgi:hypothetical protein
MKLVVVLGAVLAFAGACKKKDAAPASSGSGAGSGAAGSGSAAAGADGAGANGAGAGSAEVLLPAKLELDESDGDGLTDDTFKSAFGEKKVPRLPAISTDGKTLAVFRYPDFGGQPMIPTPIAVAFVKFPGGETVKSIDILSEDEGTKWADQEPAEWLTPAVAKTLQTRGAEVMKALEGFHSLAPVPLEGDTDDPKPTKIGDLTLTTSGGKRGDEELALVLRDAKGNLIHRERVESYSEGDRGEAFEHSACNYSPTVDAVYRDPARPKALYFFIGFFWQEMCSMATPHYIAWSTDPSTTTSQERVEELVRRQFDVLTDDDDKVTPEILASDALCVDRNIVEKPDEMPGIGPGNYDGKHDDRYVTIEMARDGKSAWASFFTTLALGDLKHGDMPQDKRVSDFIVQTPRGWRIAARAWTDDVDNATANKDAKAGKLKAQPLKPEPGDASLNAAFAKLTTDGATNVAKDIVAIGSGPGERTVGAAAFAKPWNAVWKGKTTIVSSVARLAPSGTTGWVAATVELQKKGYKIPFTVFAVFDKDASGAWTLVHIHFTV